MAFQHADFCAYADFCAGEHAHWVKAQRLKTQSSTYCKPALSVMEQNSSHLQDFSNAFPIKDGFK